MTVAELVRATGAAAGLAAVVGLALLSALALAQARDVRRLRAWADGTVPATAAPRGRLAARHVAIALGGALAVVAGVALLAGGDEGASPHARPTPKRRAVALRPAQITVAVLNGTMVDGLAARLREQLAAAGFRRGAIAVFPDQQRAASVVQYAPGRRAAARAVGRALGVASLQPATADARALAGGAAVVVIAGADQAP
jgi:hypothetical protein